MRLALCSVGGGGGGGGGSNPRNTNRWTQIDHSQLNDKLINLTGKNSDDIYASIKEC